MSICDGLPINAVSLPITAESLCVVTPESPWPKKNVQVKPVSCRTGCGTECCHTETAFLLSHQNLISNSFQGQNPTDSRVQCKARWVKRDVISSSSPCSVSDLQWGRIIPQSGTVCKRNRIYEGEIATGKWARWKKAPPGQKRWDGRREKANIWQRHRRTNSVIWPPDEPSLSTDGSGVYDEKAPKTNR